MKTLVMSVSPFQPFLNSASDLTFGSPPVLLPRPTMPRISVPNIPDRIRQWKHEQRVSSNLAEKLVGDVVIGTGVTFTIIPALVVVDRAIVQSAAGTHTLLASGAETVSMLFRNPISFVRSPAFLLMWGVYAATYSTANSLKTIMEHREYYSSRNTQTHKNQGKFAIFLGTSLVNCGGSLLKDRAYARMFGTAGAAPRVPLGSMGFWAARDFLVVGSSFILPDIVSKKLQDDFNLERGDAQKIAQIASPIAMQVLCGPLQLAGLDLYNRPLQGMGWQQRVVNRSQFLAQGFTGVVSARIARIIPGYAVGGVLNTHFRDNWRNYLIQREIRQLQQDGKDARNLVRLVGLKDMFSK